MRAVNLLPPDMRGASKASSERTVVSADDSSSFGAFAVLGALALAVLAVAGIVLTGNAIKDREAELASVQAQQAQIASRVAALKPYADFDQMANGRVATVRDLAGRRFDWEQVIRDLSRAIPAEVALSDLTGNVSTDVGGAGGSSLRGAIAAPAITIGGCTTNQRGVARLMARLRNIDGVTRVSLAKSEKNDTGTGSGVGVGSAVPASAEAAYADRRAAPCGSGRRPTFEMVMFFEGEAEAASGPSASPTQAGATPAAAATPAAGAAAPASTPAAGATPAPSTTTTTQGGVTP